MKGNPNMKGGPMMGMPLESVLFYACLVALCEILEMLDSDTSKIDGSRFVPCQSA